MGVRGDFDHLDRIIEMTDRLARSGVRELAGELGAQALELVDEGFNESRAPSGRRWEPPHYRRGRPLIRSGRLRASWVLVARANGFEILSRAPYARKLQRGRGRMPARRMVPDAGEITARWERALDAHATEWMESFSERAR